MRKPVPVHASFWLGCSPTQIPPQVRQIEGAEPLPAGSWPIEPDENTLATTGTGRVPTSPCTRAGFTTSASVPLNFLWLFGDDKPGRSVQKKSPVRVFRTKVRLLVIVKRANAGSHPESASLPSSKSSHGAVIQTSWAAPRVATRSESTEP